MKNFLLICSVVEIWSDYEKVIVLETYFENSHKTDFKHFEKCVK